MNKKIRDLVEEHRRKKWTEHLEKCDLRSGVKRLWNTIKTLSGNVKKTGSQAITFEKPVYDPEEIANKFNQQYTPPIRKKVVQETRQTLRNLKTSSTERAVITTMEGERVFQSTKPSKALGPDELSPLMLKHLGPKAHSYIARMFQTSLNTGVIPSIWKMARIIPLLKPGKPDDTGKSYRPVSLLSPPVKALETLHLPTLTEHLPMADHQHGFRKGRSTTTALYEIDYHITRGLNRRKPVDRTVLVAFVFSSVDRTVLRTSEPLLIRSISTNYWTSYLPQRSQSTPSAGSATTYEDARRMWSLETPSPLFAKWEQVYPKEVCCHSACSSPTCLDCQHHLTASNSHRTRTTARHTRQCLLFPRFVRSWTATWIPCMSGLRSMIWNTLLASPRQQSSPLSERKWACHCRLKSDRIQYRPRRTRRYWESPWTVFTHSTPTPTTLSTN